MSLRLRLTAWYGALLGVSLLAFASLLYLVLARNLEQQVDEALRLRAAQIARAISPGPNGVLDPADVAPSQLRPLTVEEAVGPDLYVQVYDDRARLVAVSGSQLPIDPDSILSALDGRESLASLPLSGGRTVRLLTRPVSGGNVIVGVVQVG